MTFRIISLPPFQAAVSGSDPACDFSPIGILGKFDQYFTALQPTPRDSFMPRDFLYFDPQQGGMVWMYALTEGIDPSGYEVIDFPGGLYLTYAYRDGDEDDNAALYQQAMQFIEETTTLAIDETRPSMGHIITPREAQQALGYAQMETFIPLKIK